MSDDKKPTVGYTMKDHEPNKPEAGVVADNELKPCPFCGGEAEIVQYGTPRYSTIIECQECGCKLENGETFNHGNAWNRRDKEAGE